METNQIIIALLVILIVGVVVWALSFMRKPSEGESSEGKPKEKNAGGSFLAKCLKVLGVVMLCYCLYLFYESPLPKLTVAVALPYLFYALASFALAEILNRH